MTTLREWIARLLGLLRWGRTDRDLEQELRLHLDLAAEAERRGQASVRAPRVARVHAGGVAQALETLRDRRGVPWLEDLGRDFRLGLRLLRRSPFFGIFAVTSLALGIGVTVAIFSLFDGIVLRKLQVPQPDELITASFGNPQRGYNYSLPYPQFEQVRQRNTTLAGVFALTPIGRVTVSVAGAPEIAEGLYVSGDYYRVLGLIPAAGRLIQPADDRPGETVAVLTHEYWRRRFGGRRDVIGTAVALNGLPFTIVGVEPAGFVGTEAGRPYDVSVPLRARDALDAGTPLWNRPFSTWIYILGRLKPDVTIAHAESELRAIFTQTGIAAARAPNEIQLAREFQLRLELAATGATSELRDTHEKWLRLLLIVLGAVLLLASLNVAALLLARANARQREISTRLALGAGRTRIVRQLLTESMVLATVAGCFGFMLGVWGGPILLGLLAPAADRLPIALTPDLRLVAFTIAVSALTCLVFGLIPALRITSPRRLLATRQIGSGGGRRATDRILVAAQVALSLVLLVGAGLFLRTLNQLWAQDPGYDRRNVVMFSVDAQLAGMKGPETLPAYRNLLEALRAVPGAESVSASAVRAVSDNYYFVDSVSVPADQAGAIRRVRVAYNHIAPAYFATLGIPLLAGRDFEYGDVLDRPKVAIISERLARHFTGNPIGQRLGNHEVVGVAKDVRYANIKDAPREVVYYSLLQSRPSDIFYSPTFEIRYTGSVRNIVSVIEAAVERVDPRFEMFRVRTLEEQTQDSISRERLLALMTSYLGGFSVALACLGLYGLMSYTVLLRASEIGVRMALGAQPGAVHWMVIREAAVTVLAGTVVGLLGALAGEQLVSSQLFGVQPHDPIVLACATALLLVMSLAAAYLPARRASRINPINALRQA